LARRFSCSIDIEDKPTVPLPIPQSGCVLFGRKSAGQQILKQAAAQGFNRFSGERG
jgi:hypothetical protein